VSAAELDLDGIEARAKAATPGPWRAEGHEINAGYGADFWMVGDVDSSADAAHIAGLSPDVALELCAEVRRLRKLAEAERALRLTERACAAAGPSRGEQVAAIEALKVARDALRALGGEP